MKLTGLKIFAGVVAGAAAGMITGVLITPYSGKTTRRKLGLFALKQRQELEEKTHEAVEKIKDATDYAAMNLKKKYSEFKHKNHKILAN